MTCIRICAPLGRNLLKHTEQKFVPKNETRILCTTHFPVCLMDSCTVSSDNPMTMDWWLPMFLQNAGNHVQEHTASQHRRPQATLSPPSKPQISLFSFFVSACLYFFVMDDCPSYFMRYLSLWNKWLSIQGSRFTAGKNVENFTSSRLYPGAG